tara:strand:+ start:2031 stop:2594 length:564 start_codon:yes stop_codon:yes gene_type:complete
MNRNYIFLLVLLLLWWYLSKGKVQNKVINDPVIPIISNFPCQECAEKYNLVEVSLDNWINQSKLLIIKSSSNDIAFREMRNEYLYNLHNFINCIKGSSSITPIVLADPNFSSGYSYTYIVYSNISPSQDPIERYDPYNVFGHWDITDQYYLPNSFDADTLELLRLNANYNGWGTGVIIDLLNINWNC